MGINILTTNPAKFIWEDFLSPLMKGIGIMKELLKLNDVYVEIKGKYFVRENECDSKTRDVIGLIGKNGAGKSTLLN